MAKRKTPPRRGAWAATGSPVSAADAVAATRAPPLVFNSSRRVSDAMRASLPNDGTRTVRRQRRPMSRGDRSRGREYCLLLRPGRERSLTKIAEGKIMRKILSLVLIGMVVL